MCGISGVLFKKNDKKYKQQIEKMNALIEHRGPDDNGIYVNDNFAFGHTRLSILDTGNGGHQPMEYQERYVITYNGEVYNYVEIKDELKALGYSFSNQSDTEVILAGYAHWKEKVVDKLNGMFSFAIYDLLEKKCFIARDRTGVKPLYYYQSEEDFYFFSEPKQVIISDIIAAKPNVEAINDYLAFQFSLSEDTFFQGIKKLLPGSAILFENGNAKIHKYWSLDDVEVDETITFTQAKEKITALVEDAVKLRLRSDVPVGSYLSGGIDSSVVATLASESLPGISTYTFTSKAHPNQDESVLASKTATHIKSDHNEIEIDFDNIVGLWQKAIYFMDEPEVGFSLIPQMEISKKVSKDLKVILGGQGGDELFYGYGWHSHMSSSLFTPLKGMPFVCKVRVLLNQIKNMSLRSKAKVLLSAFRSKSIENNYFSLWVSNGAFNLLKNKNIKKRFMSKINGDKTLLAIKKFEYNYWLQALLHVEDRSSMSASLESRTPLLDYRIAEYAFSLPPALMIDGKLNKRILISSFNDKLLTEVYENSQKKGYSAPINDWFENPKVSSYINEILDNKDSFIHSLIVDVHRNALTVRQIWLLISLEIWHKIFITKEIKHC